MLCKECQLYGGSMFRVLTVPAVIVFLLLNSGFSSVARGGASAKPNESLSGEWASVANGAVQGYYDFDPAGKGHFSGYAVNGGCAAVPGDIQDVAQGHGSYTGTENTFSSVNPCVIAGTATNTIQISPGGKTAQWVSAGCSDCGPQSWKRATPVWGFDTSQLAKPRFLKSKAIAALGHPKFVGQYLDNWQGAHDALTSVAVKAVHAVHARVLLIANPRVRGNK